MTESNKKNFNPNATIQITLDEVQLAEIESALGPGKRVHSQPPPLPAPPLATSQDPAIEPIPDAADIAAHRSMGKKIAYGAMAVALLGAAIAAGLRVGGSARRSMRGAPGAATAVVSIATPASAASHVPPESTSAAILKVPTIEMR